MSAQHKVELQAHGWQFTAAEDETVLQAATRAGCPSVVVPFMDEQLFWGEQLHRLGLSPPPLLAKRAHADRLAQRIRAVLSNPRYLRHAQAARQRIVERNGVQEAVFLIEGLGS